MKLLRYLTIGLSVTVLCACGANNGDVGAKPAAEATPVDEKAQNATDVRQAVLKLMYTNFGPLGGMARGKVPFDAQLAKKNALRLAQLVRMLGDSFVYDTRGSGVETEALDRIWTDGALYADKLEALIVAADALDAAAGSGEEAQVKQAVGGVGKACGSCHDDFREDDD